MVGGMEGRDRFKGGSEVTAPSPCSAVLFVCLFVFGLFFNKFLSSIDN